MQELNYEYEAKVFKALSHPVRLKIIDELASGRKCVSELACRFTFDMSTISRHLNQLKEAGIIDSVKEGQNVFYELKMKCVVYFMYCVREVRKGTDIDIKIKPF